MYFKLSIKNLWFKKCLNVLKGVSKDVQTPWCWIKHQVNYRVRNSERGFTIHIWSRVLANIKYSNLIFESRYLFIIQIWILIHNSSLDIDSVLEFFIRFHSRILYLIPFSNSWLDFKFSHSNIKSSKSRFWLNWNAFIVIELRVVIF